MKDGWHPEGKGGRKESWRNDFKGINQVAGWMGKGKDPESEKSEHVSRPLASLKDPSSFAPPPKHINYHGAAAVPNQTTPDRSGLGAPLSQNQVEYQNTQQQQAIEEETEAEQKPKPPPVPYRVNTTGLSTENLPPPPRRLDSPSSGSSNNTVAAQKPKPKPSLPPRVPPRNSPQVSQDDAPPPAYTPVAPSSSDGYINQQATSRLANAGISVPALGIGESNNGQQAETTNSNSPVNELNSRFSNMQTNSGTRSAPPPPPPARTSTLQSAQAFRERHADKIDAGKQKLGGMASRVNTYVDERRSSSATPNAPSSASTLPPRDAEEALPPAQGFRERHADKIDLGKQKWGGVTSRINTLVEDRKFSAEANKRIPRPPGPQSPATSSSPASSTAGVGATPIEAQARKKAPPPPPPKRAEIRAAPASESPVSSASTPPPVPLNTKPR